MKELQSLRNQLYGVSVQYGKGSATAKSDYVRVSEKIEKSLIKLSGEFCISLQELASTCYKICYTDTNPLKLRSLDRFGWKFFEIILCRMKADALFSDERIRSNDREELSAYRAPVVCPEILNSIKFERPT